LSFSSSGLAFSSSSGLVTSVIAATIIYKIRTPFTAATALRAA